MLGREAKRPRDFRVYLQCPHTMVRFKQRAGGRHKACSRCGPSQSCLGSSLHSKVTWWSQNCVTSLSREKAIPMIDSTLSVFSFFPLCDPQGNSFFLESIIFLSLTTKGRGTNVSLNYLSSCQGVDNNIPERCSFWGSAEIKAPEWRWAGTMSANTF